MQKPMLMNEIKLTHEDVPGVTETFVDSVHAVMAGDGIVRIEFCTTRLDEPHPPPSPMTGRKTTAARLAMPAKAAAEMIALISPLPRVPRNVVSLTAALDSLHTNRLGN